MKCTHVIAAAVALVASVTVFSCADSVDNPVEKAAKIRTSKNETVVAAVKNIATAKKELETSGGFGTLTLNFEGSISVEEFESLRSALRELNDVRDENGNLIKANNINVILDFSKAELPDNSIPNDGLKNCRKLGGILLPDSVKKIGDWALNECGQELTGFTEFKMGVYDKSTKMPVYGVLPPKLTEIGDCAFGWCSSLASIIIPDGVKTLTGTFIGCDRLNFVFIGKGVTALKDFPESDPAKGNFGVFEGCKSLSYVYYAGKVAEWYEITRDPNWRKAIWYDPSSAVPANYVHCSDGGAFTFVRLTSLSLDRTSVSVVGGTSTTLTLVPTPANAECDWKVSTSEPIFAAGSCSGNTITVNGFLPGDATLTIQDNNTGISKTFSVSVTFDIDAITEVLPIGDSSSSNPDDYKLVTLTSSEKAKLFKITLEENKTYVFEVADTCSNINDSCTGDAHFALLDNNSNYLPMNEGWGSPWDDGTATYTVPNGKGGTYCFAILSYHYRNPGKCGVHVYKQ